MAMYLKVTDWSRGPKDGLFTESTAIPWLSQATSAGKKRENKMKQSPKVRHIQTLMYNSIYPGKCDNWAWNLQWAKQFISTFLSISVGSGIRIFYSLITCRSFCKCVRLSEYLSMRPSIHCPVWCIWHTYCSHSICGSIHVGNNNDLLLNECTE